MKTFNIGDPLLADDLNKWQKQGPNYMGGRGIWEASSVPFCGDRTILKIQEVDGVMAALVSDTCNVWIRLEGFMSLQESYQIY